MKEGTTIPLLDVTEVPILYPLFYERQEHLKPALLGLPFIFAVVSMNDTSELSIDALKLKCSRLLHQTFHVIESKKFYSNFFIS